MEVRYSEKDQAILDEASNHLFEYEKLLLHRLQRFSSNGETNNSEACKEFLNDPAKKAMVKNICNLKALMTPVYICNKREAELLVDRYKPHVPQI